jgi:hypothetical protein
MEAINIELEKRRGKKKQKKKQLTFPTKRLRELVSLSKEGG